MTSRYSLSPSASRAGMSISRPESTNGLIQRSQDAASEPAAASVTSATLHEAPPREGGGFAEVGGIAVVWAPAGAAGHPARRIAQARRPGAWRCHDLDIPGPAP